MQQGGPTTPKLQRVNIVIANQNYCRYVYNELGLNVYPTQVCAYDSSDEKGSCNVSFFKISTTIRSNILSIHLFNILTVIIYTLRSFKDSQIFKSDDKVHERFKHRI